MTAHELDGELLRDQPPPGGVAGEALPHDPADWGSRDPDWAGIHADTVEVHGHPVSLLRADGDPGGIPQLFVHGLGGSARNWIEVMNPFAERGAAVAVDLPGFGATPVPEGGSARMRANARFLPALLDALGWERAVVFGNSMGGALVTLMAHRHPDRVERLVLVNAALPAPRRDMLRVSKRVVSRLLPAAVPGLGRAMIEAGYRYRSPEQLVDETLEGILGDAARVRPVLREVLIDNVRMARDEVWRRVALAEAAGSLIAMIAGGTTLTRGIDGIEPPTLVLWGDRDRLVSRHVIAGLAARRPDWEQHVFEDVGHAPMIEVPDAFVQVVTDWYQRGS